MEDNSFVYFTQDDVLKNIDIDPRLVESFKRVMTRLQKYFNEKGYTKDRDYKEYLERNLFKLGDKSISIGVDNNMHPNLGGFYNRFECKIRINETKLNEEYLDSILCHEFIHFLVMHELEYGVAEEAIIEGGFINEALTELLTQDIYPDVNADAYRAQVTMHKFANKLSGNENNFRMFLLGKIDAKCLSAAWMNYLNCCDSFQDEFDELGYIDLNEAQHNKNYILAQRALITLYINTHTIRSFQEYCDNVKKLVLRPVMDEEYVNKHIELMERGLISNFGVNNTYLKEIIINKIKEVRELVKQLSVKDHYFEFAGKRLSIDDKLQITSYDGLLLGFFSVRSPNNDSISLSYNQDSITLKKEDLILDKTEINKKIEEISKYFTKEAKNCYPFITKALEQDGNLIKIERFKLSNNQSIPYIYVATYDDKFVVLNQHDKISDNTNNKDKEIIYSLDNEKQIIYKAIELYSKTLSEEEIEQAIIEYKNSGLCFSNNKKIIRADAIDYLSTQKFELLKPEEKQEYIEQVKSKSIKYKVSINNGIVDVGLMDKDILDTCTREVLYDLNNKEIFNDLVNELKQCNIEKKILPSIDISLGVIKKQHSTMINKIESLLGIEITNYFELKDKYTLTNEQREINKRLTQLYYEGKINYKDYIEMKQAILIEYSNMVKNAPEPVIEQEYVQENEHRMNM